MKNLLKGVNLGGWLLMEGYILGGRNIPAQVFKRQFLRKNGARRLREFEQSYSHAFIQEHDFRRIASWGANCIRLPFHYGFFEYKPYCYDKTRLGFLKTVLHWAGKYSLKVILDLHAAAGAQNYDWHSDSDGQARLWRSRKFQDRTVALWEYLAAELKEEKALYGYDVLNEPVIGKERIAILRNLYERMIRSIRVSDPGRVIFLEGNIWAQEIDFLQDLLAENIAVSIHSYQPLEFTFNFLRQTTYPGMVGGSTWNRQLLKQSLERYQVFAGRNNTHIYVGEFGINFRGNTYGELQWLDDILGVFNEFGFSWTYWTYKAISNSVFPDGIMQYNENPAWVRREGPIYGWENYPGLWKNHKKAIIESLNSARFRENEEIIAVLKKYF